MAQHLARTVTDSPVRDGPVRLVHGPLSVPGTGPSRAPHVRRTAHLLTTDTDLHHSRRRDRSPSNRTMIGSDGGFFSASSTTRSPAAYGPSSTPLPPDGLPRRPRDHPGHAAIGGRAHGWAIRPPNPPAPRADQATTPRWPSRHSMSSLAAPTLNDGTEAVRGLGSDAAWVASVCWSTRWPLKRARGPASEGTGVPASGTRPTLQCRSVRCCRGRGARSAPSRLAMRETSATTVATSPGRRLVITLSTLRFDCRAMASRTLCTLSPRPRPTFSTPAPRPVLSIWCTAAQ